MSKKGEAPSRGVLFRASVSALRLLKAVRFAAGAEGRLVCGWGCQACVYRTARGEQVIGVDPVASCAGPRAVTVSKRTCRVPHEAGLTPEYSGAVRQLCARAAVQ